MLLDYNSVYVDEFEVYVVQIEYQKYRGKRFNPINNVAYFRAANGVGIICIKLL